MKNQPITTLRPEVLTSFTEDDLLPRDFCHGEKVSALERGNLLSVAKVPRQQIVPRGGILLASLTEKITPTPNKTAKEATYSSPKSYLLSNSLDSSMSRSRDIKLEDKVEAVQKRAARQQARLVLMYKAVNNMVAIPIHNILTKNTNITRGHHSRFITIPCKTEAYRASYFPRTVIEWNTLPGGLRVVGGEDHRRATSGGGDNLRRATSGVGKITGGLRVGPLGDTQLCNALQQGASPLAVLTKAIKLESRQYYFSLWHGVQLNTQQTFRHEASPSLGGSRCGRGGRAALMVAVVVVALLRLSHGTTLE
ncbi:hypothetical protein Bbelb_225440 [Branchiostoma belcheri]|nr:hypothetical protein Bbelb_225440 [Branchiostoma belcheri]